MISPPPRTFIRGGGKVIVEIRNNCLIESINFQPGQCGNPGSLPDGIERQEPVRLLRQQSCDAQRRRGHVLGHRIRCGIAGLQCGGCH